MRQWGTGARVSPKAGYAGHSCGAGLGRASSRRTAFATRTRWQPQCNVMSPASDNKRSATTCRWSSRPGNGPKLWACPCRCLQSEGRCSGRPEVAFPFARRLVAHRSPRQALSTAAGNRAGGRTRNGAGAVPLEEVRPPLILGRRSTTLRTPSHPTSSSMPVAPWSSVSG